MKILALPLITITIALGACGGGSGGGSTQSNWHPNAVPNSWDDPLLHVSLSATPDDVPYGTNLVLADGNGIEGGAASTVPNPYLGKVFGFDRRHNVVRVYEYGSSDRNGELTAYCAQVDELKLISARRFDDTENQFNVTRQYTAETQSGLEYLFFFTSTYRPSTTDLTFPNDYEVSITGQHPVGDVPFGDRLIEFADMDGDATMKCRLRSDLTVEPTTDLPYPRSNRPDLRMYDLASADAPEPSLRAFKVIHNEFAAFGSYNPDNVTLVDEGEFSFIRSVIPGVRFDVYYLDERLGYFARAKNENTCELFDLHTAKRANVLRPIQQFEFEDRDYAFVIGKARYDSNGGVEYPKPDEVNAFNHAAEVILSSLGDIEVRTVASSRFVSPSRFSSEADFVGYSSIHRAPTVEIDVPSCVDEQIKEKLRLDTLLRWRTKGQHDFVYPDGPRP